MSFWRPPAIVSPGEKIVFSGPGDMFKARRLIIGHITVTETHFYFRPNRLDARFGNEPVEFPLSDILGVSLAPGGQRAGIERGAAAARRVQVDIDRPGTKSVVTVKDPEALIELLDPRE
ncbi:MAG: hypothetical protein JWM76_1818 [Pseudonocardiales bacterium]|nr:hypothetical protein [Pseudonocardiales bacterium]